MSLDKTIHETRILRLENVDNVRDLGGIPVYGDRQVISGLIFRGSALYGASDHDKQVLFEDLGITCVIDLRCGWEVKDKPNPQIEGIDNLHIPFYDLEKVGIEYDVGAKSGQKVGRDVACDPDDFYRSLSNPKTVAQMSKALTQLIARASNGLPVYQHCSGGKDRTGVMSMLTLIILGASLSDIVDDYLLTNVSRDEKHETTFKKFLRIAEGDAAKAERLIYDHRAKRGNLEAFMEAVCERYGDMESFVHDQLGIGEALRERFRSNCTQPMI